MQKFLTFPQFDLFPSVEVNLWHTILAMQLKKVFTKKRTLGLILFLCIFVLSGLLLSLCLILPSVIMFVDSVYIYIALK